MNPPDFQPFDKIPRLNREVIITEKIDGTNASIFIGESGEFFCASRTRWIKPGDDNFGFAAWAHENKNELLTLGPGHHFGEWWGKGIQRGYGLDHRRFSLFNVTRWADTRPTCCHIVPVLAAGVMLDAVPAVVENLARHGSVAAPGYSKPEGVVAFHTASRTLFKVTIEKDAEPKSKSEAKRLEAQGQG